MAKTANRYNKYFDENDNPLPDVNSKVQAPPKPSDAYWPPGLPGAPTNRYAAKYPGDYDEQPKPPPKHGPIMDPINAGMAGFTGAWGLDDLSSTALRALPEKVRPEGAMSKEQSRAELDRLAKDNPWSSKVGGILGETAKLATGQKLLSAAIPYFGQAGYIPTMASGGLTNLASSAAETGKKLYDKGMEGVDWAREGVKGATAFAEGGLMSGFMKPIMSAILPSARFANSVPAPFSQQTQDAVKRASTTMKNLIPGAQPTLPQAMRFTEQNVPPGAGPHPGVSEATRMAPRVQGLLNNTGKQEATELTEQATDRALINARGDPSVPAGRRHVPDSPAKPLYDIADSQRIPFTPNLRHPTNANIAQAEADVWGDTKLMSEIRRRMGVGPNDPVRHGVPFQQAVKEKLETMPESRTMLPRNVKEDVGRVQRNIQDQSPPYREASQVHARFSDAVRELENKNPPSLKPQSDTGNFLQRMFNEIPGLNTAASIPKAITNPGTARLLSNPDNIGKMGIRTGAQDAASALPTGLLNMTDEEQAEWMVKMLRGG